VNGAFTSGTSGWGCSPEVNTESVYGGPSSNAVDEVDAAANICQTVSGFAIGSSYSLSLLASRRTGGCPSPATTNMNITIDGGALAVTLTRTNATFGLTSAVYVFTATSNAHTITFSAGSGFGGSTCGMIVDNIALSGAILPIELIDFYAEANGAQVDLYWSTASEKNNHHFEIEKTTDGFLFENTAILPSKAKNGNSSARINYSAEDMSPGNGTVYYRLKQVDHDGSFSLSRLITMYNEQEKTPDFTIFPNPNQGNFRLDLKNINNSSPVEFLIYNSMGALVYSEYIDHANDQGSTHIFLDLQSNPGYYLGVIRVGKTTTYRKKMIVE